ncbi:hypothetical protein ACTVPT_26765, partial [Serratia bockelmannii]|uniref:hypothetical protein n=1 Tax=Serratia bockelmannii TaxID=2703793 RepID=UPI003FA6D1D7
LFDLTRYRNIGIYTIFRTGSVLASFFGSRRHLMRTDISLMLTQCIHGGNKDVRTPSTAVVSGI